MSLARSKVLNERLDFPRGIMGCKEGLACKEGLVPRAEGPCGIECLLAL